MQRSIHTSIVDCQMSTGKEDPALENASPSMVKERASTSHKLEYLCNLFPLSAVDLWVALELYRQTNSAWEHPRAWRTNFTKWTISNGENFPWYTLVRHLRKEKFISESVQIYFKGMNNREYEYWKKKKIDDLEMERSIYLVVSRHCITGLNLVALDLVAALTKKKLIMLWKELRMRLKEDELNSNETRCNMPWTCNRREQ